MCFCFRGIPAVHYLIFSDNVMVRRAAIEALCNMPTHESILKVESIITFFVFSFR